MSAVGYVICEKCGRKADRRFFHLGMCQSCYNYYHSGGTNNPIPEKGEIKLDRRGFVICHICGRAYKRLGSHIRESHDMTIKEYKECFGLCNNAKTTERTYSVIMRKLAYKNGMPERLVKAGFNTRIKKGETDKRKGKRVRLQECLDKRKRHKD